MPKKVFPIKYTSRDFDSIKSDLVDYTRKYYPDTFKDFNEASFGSLMLDSVAYIGDILSFYLDYQVNESFLNSAIEFDNILRLGEQVGYKYEGLGSSTGKATFYITIPAASSGNGPDLRYIPILKKGTSLSSRNGANFLLNEDVDFSKEGNEIVVAQVDSTTGLPTSFAVRAYGTVISGKIEEQRVEVGAFEPFKKYKLAKTNIAEVLTVVDAEGHIFYEVSHLSQDTIYRAVTNQQNSEDSSTEILKPFVVPRRFIVSRNRNSTFIQFGASSNFVLPEDQIADPSNVILKQNGKAYIPDTTFDPTKLTTSDKFGVAPSNTTLFIAYRVNDPTNLNARVGALNAVVGPNFEFANPDVLDTALVQNVITSIETENEEAIIGQVALPSSEELKNRIFGTFASQGRAVTSADYESMVYQMPKKFGEIKRCKIFRDSDSLKRNLNLYIISENSAGQLVEANDSIKENLKTWVTDNKMISDTIDILDAKVVNLEISFVAIADFDRSKFDILSDATDQLISFFSRAPDIGEPFFITDVYNQLKKVDGIVDVSDVKISQKTGGDYSTISFNVAANTSADGRYVEMPKNVIWEIKFPTSNIKGVLK